MFKHIIFAIFFWQLVNEIGGCFNDIVFILDFEKMKNNSTLEKINRNAELMRLVETNFESEMASLGRMRKKNLIILKWLQNNFSPFFVLFVVCWHLNWHLNINWKFSENCNKLTECTNDSPVVKIYLNIMTIFIFIEQ